jgi:thioredoxin reductase
MSASSHDHWDVIIIGAGPAGLSAALMLGRCRRRVLLLDDGRPRNAKAHASHGFFTRDGSSPAELLRIGREQLARYGVRMVAATVTHACIESGLFVVSTADERHVARKLLLGTGIVDKLPSIDGIDELYGCSVFHCPYCDGWEVADRALAVYGRNKEAVDYALGMTVWGQDLVFCSDGLTRLGVQEKLQLRAHGIVWRSEPIAQLVGKAGQLRRIVFADGSSIERDAMFIHAGTEQRSHLAAMLGCAFTRRGSVKTGNRQESGLTGLYVAGDAARDVKFVAMAVAEGTKAGVAINRALRLEDSDARLAHYVRSAVGLHDLHRTRRKRKARTRPLHDRHELQQ